MKAREQLTEAIADAVPKKWRVIDTDEPFDTLDNPTIALHQSDIRPGPYTGSLLVDFSAALMVAHTDIARAEHALDDAVVEILTIFRSHPWLSFSRAQKGIYKSNPAYEFTLTILTQIKE